MKFNKENLIENLIPFMGNKYRVKKHQGYLLQRILHLVPDDVDIVYEPFAGLGCISFNIALNNPGVKIRLSDINKGLIKIFNDIKKDPNDVYQQLENEVNLIDNYENIDQYYIKNFYNHKYEDLPISRLLLYTKFSMFGNMKLNKQGIIMDNSHNFKYNSRTKFNTKNYLNEMESKILRYSDLMNSIDFKYEHKDWNDVFEEKLNKNDLLILDPPYTKSKVNYGSKEVKWDDIFKKYKEYGDKVHWIHFDYYNRERPLDKTLLYGTELHENTKGINTNQKISPGSKQRKNFEYILTNIVEDIWVR